MQQQIMGLINPAIALVFASLFLLLWMCDKSRRHVAFFAGGYAMLAGGFLTFHFVSDPSARLPILLMHVFYSTSCSLLAAGAARRVGQHMEPAYFVIIGVVSSILMIASTYGLNQNPRLYVANSAYGLIFILGAHAMGLAARRDLVDRAIFWLFAFIAAQFFIRPAATFILEETITAQEYRDSVYYAVMVIAVAVFSLILALTLLASTILDQLDLERKTADTDLLTGLQSRRAFEQDALAMLARSKARDKPVALIVADLDHFKKVNDIWGHQVGDNAIAVFGQLIRSTIRETDIAGRVGGEEFCIAVWNCSGSAAARLAERIRIALTRAEIDGLPDDIHLTASFGVAAFSGDDGYGRLFGRADAALYKAKDAGRNTVQHDGEGEPELDTLPVKRPFQGSASIRAAA
ncbi:GGDEF domain-containing protein [Erythrobacteraceae bacterium WH01K]|nr:GGDEF domain-containing protein [Erythrobacteraceae bacterium WH01K]